jgi:hypothetical protein
LLAGLLLQACERAPEETCCRVGKHALYLVRADSGYKLLSLAESTLPQEALPPAKAPDSLLAAAQHSWPLPYPVYRWGCADITGDGRKEVHAGPIKPTRFDSVRRRRAFFFKVLEGGAIRPLYLASSFGVPLRDYRVLQDSCLVVVRAAGPQGQDTLLTYRWNKFGFAFDRYAPASAYNFPPIDTHRHALLAPDTVYGPGCGWGPGE